MTISLLSEPIAFVVHFDDEEMAELVQVLPTSDIILASADRLPEGWDA